MKLSWSAIESWEQCPLKFHKTYVERVKGLVGDQRVFLVGSVVHDATKAWAAADYAEGFFESQAANIFDKLATKKVPDITDLERFNFFKRVRSALIGVREVYTDLHFAEHKAEIEKWFSVFLTKDSQLVGAIDVYDPVTGLIYDLKTTESGHGELGQLKTYGVAVRRFRKLLTGGAFIYPLQQKRVVPKELPLEAIEEQRRTYVKYAKLFEGGYDLVAKPGYQCKSCPYFQTEHCPTTLNRAQVRPQLVNGSREIDFAPPSNVKLLDVEF